MFNVTRWLTVVVFVTIIGVSGSYAQATRTWVSGVGDDANPCSRTAPCKTFAGAISKTAQGGEIDTLDSGDFGPVIITKAITIDGGGGSIAAVTVFNGGNGVLVNAGINETVILRNLAISGDNSGGNGVKFLTGGALYVENVTITGFAQYGIDFEPSVFSNLSVTRTLIRDMSQGALLVRPSSSGSALATVTGSRFENGQFGAWVEDRSDVTFKDSIAANNAVGFVAMATTNLAIINLEGCISANNFYAGIVAGQPGATISLSNTRVTRNSLGILFVSGANVVSFGDNRISGNLTMDGTPTSIISQE